ncbi:MAG: hypothetical protein K0U84_09120 [Actinomycetia bacterium]|nr:hypothetical protein [Actinomycetes bacterium]
MLEKLTTAKARQYFYAVTTALIAFAVGYDWISADKVPLWLGLMAAVFAIGATSTATLVVKKQRADGVLD